jgi:hypothetical protein
VQYVVRSDALNEAFATGGRSLQEAHVRGNISANGRTNIYLYQQHKLAGPSCRAVWDVGVDRLIAELVGSSPA